MDKIGMTLSAGIWGYVLQSVSSKSKVLLSLGLLVNILASAVFAMTTNRYVLYSTKLLIGMSEGLQWVWAPLWVVKWADETSLPLWINLSGCVAAGVGSGLGMLVAGFGTAHGLPCAVPFQIEAAVLFLLFLLMMLTPGAQLASSSAGTRDGVKQDVLQFEAGEWRAGLPDKLRLPPRRGRPTERNASVSPRLCGSRGRLASSTVGAAAWDDAALFQTAQAVAAFQAESDGEVTVLPGEPVTVLRHPDADEDWVFVCVRGLRGWCAREIEHKD
ncbi:unnamed protein product [Symbiodinium natans]|uniref:Major facilitator superfamily (MFS) profile domain-containing protein n=1 Tax=Symbiodinium natans TaxID=878477 RepID=A0A812UT69_9DINO|nr:unnamed protein product [Symbiodinium natans]